MSSSPRYPSLAPEWQELLDRTEAIYGPQKRQRRPQARGFVYFVQENESGLVKIGWAANPVTRLRSMQTGNPRRLTLVAYIYTSRRQLEREIHERFAGGRERGEWFRWSREMGDWICDNAEVLP